MLGLMQDRPLLISQMIEFAAAYYPKVEIVTRSVEGPIHRYGYRDAALRAKKVAEALQGLGIKLGDRVGTIAWNTYRHFELYFGISGLGAVLHTLNPRLAPEHVAYIANHAEDQVIFVDLNLLPILDRFKLAPEGAQLLASSVHLGRYFETHTARPSLLKTVPPNAAPPRRAATS